MKIKKLLSLIAAAAMTVTATIGAMTASADGSTDPSYFTVSGSIITGYTGTDTDIVLPTEIDGVTMTQLSATFYNNTSITSVVVPEGYTYMGDNTFRGCTSLKTVSLPSTMESWGGYLFRDCSSLESVNVPEKITVLGNRCFNGCSNSNLVIDMQSTVIDTSTLISTQFSNVVGTIKVYTSEMYDAFLYYAPSSSKVVLVSAKDDLDYSALDQAIADGTLINTTNYAEVKVTALKEALAAGKKVKESAEATQKDVDNATAAINNAIAGLVNVTGLKLAISKAEAINKSLYTENTVTALINAITAAKAVLTNINATETDVNNAVTAINEAINGLVLNIDYTEMDTQIAKAEDIIANHSNEYTADSINSLKSSLDTAKKNRNMDISQATVDSITGNLKNAIAKLEKIDIPAELKKLQTVIENAEALSASEYTEDSYKVLTDAINEAKKITESSTYSEIISAKTAVTNAVNKLVSKPLDPIGYIRHGWTDKAFVSGVTSEEMAGATQIRLTFDCASDTSYNQYFNTPIEAKIGSTVTNFEMKGTAAAENLGEKNCTATMTLTAPVEAGQKYSLAGYTYGYANAKDYVFAMTKVEFLDESGNVLGKVTAKTIAQDKLVEAIAKAEETDTANYTDESVAELTKAIESAKSLTDEATAEEINTAVKAIEDAVKALAYKPADYTKVDEAITKIPTDLSKYTDESVKALKDAVATVVRDKNITEQETVDGYAKAINDAVSALKVKPDTTKQDPPKPNTTNPTTKTPTKPTRSKDAVKKDKSAAKKAMKQAKISKLKVKSKAKKKINVTWKKVKKAKGYQVQVSAKKNFKKVIFKKDLKKTKLNIKNKKIKSKKTYYVRVRAYAAYKDANNKTVKVYSKWNKKLRKVTVK